jgi:hypothetical protein
MIWGFTGWQALLIVLALIGAGGAVAFAFVTGLLR